MRIASAPVAHALRVLCVMLVTAGAASRAHAAVVGGVQVTTYPTGRFGIVELRRPIAEPVEVVIFISGDGGWNSAARTMADRLVARGALVIGVDARHYLRTFDVGPKSCRYLPGEFETLAHDMQRRAGLREYRVPLLVGYSAGATLAYAVLADSPNGTFAGALSLSFCPDLPLRRDPCRGNGLQFMRNALRPIDVIFKPGARLPGAWIAMHGDSDWICSHDAAERFVSATPGARFISLADVGHGFGDAQLWVPQLLRSYNALLATGAALPANQTVARAPQVSDLPLVEVAPLNGGENSTFVILLTGDGGWAGLDREVAGAMAARGLPVIGWNSLRYYWKARSPAEAAADLARVIEHYSTTLARHDVLIVGYSFGADVLPFLVNRLPATLRERVRGIGLLGPSSGASFEVHVAEWLPGGGRDTYATLPEMQTLPMIPLLCLHGRDETKSICNQVSTAQWRSVTVDGGHHFDGDYAAVAQRLLALIK